MVDKNKVITIAKSYDGYLEKGSNSQLDSFTMNAGSNNYTKFGRDYDALMGTHLNGQPWCAMFVSMMFVTAYGVDTAKKLLGGNLFSYTPQGATQMGASNKVSPKAGDVVFFYSNSMKRISHVGLVTGVDSKRFYTIEGNTNAGNNTVIRNGGGVKQKSYTLGSSVAHFATPPYDKVGEAPKAAAPAKPKPIKFKAGNRYTLKRAVNVFAEPNKAAKKLPRKDLTDAQKGKDKNKDSKLDKGSTIVCKSVQKKSTGNIWLEIGGEGWILGYDKTNDIYNVKE